MSYPPHGQNPQQQPFPQGKQKPVKVQSVGKSVTKPAWTVSDIMWLIFTAGLAYPIIWLKRRSKTTVTRHK